MTRNITLISVFAPLALLAACGTPQENCIRGNTREYRVISGLLAETEANLARGYAWEERQVERTEWTQCRRVRHLKGDKIDVDYYPCLRDYTDTERYRVPIDPVVEQRKRDNLAAKKRALAARNDKVVAQCAAAFPEEKR